MVVDLLACVVLAHYILAVPNIELKVSLQAILVVDIQIYTSHQVCENVLLEAQLYARWSRYFQTIIDLKIHKIKSSCHVGILDHRWFVESFIFNFEICWRHDFTLVVIEIYLDSIHINIHCIYMNQLLRIWQPSSKNLFGIRWNVYWTNLKLQIAH